jgi:hypothetical protein
MIKHKLPYLLVKPKILYSDPTRSAASHSCSARNLPVVVLIDGHRPPLIDCVDDIDVGFERKLKRPHGHLVVFRSLLLRNVVLGTVREHIPGRLRGGAGGDRPSRRISLAGLLPSNAKEVLMRDLPTIVGWGAS